ncbi:ABC transporter substrate-binding protein [Saccharomonospora sp. CUA-673]|uniref:ABC transporter substrate-binding protein n=1 Tax=Saccharomonospora sp. CUA-673 TaxID=1904969 RepID=UPI000B28985A
MSKKRRLLSAAAVGLAACLVATGCTRADENTATELEDQGPADEVRLGYFPNVTHAPAIIGLERGHFEDELGDTQLTSQTFNSGTEEVNALLGGSLDIGYIGSAPAINAFTKSEGRIQVVSGAVAGGAQLVVDPEITEPEDLKGKTIATPSLGNTQDVALKKWLDEEGLTGEVNVANLDNPQTFDAFRGGEVDGGWLPEPWSSRLVEDADAEVLVDEEDLWPDGKFPTTVMLVRTEFLQQHPETVRAMVKGSLDAANWGRDNADEAKDVVDEGIRNVTGSDLPGPVLDRAFENLELTADPISSTYEQLAHDSVTAGVVDEAVDLHGFLDLRLLNELQEQADEPPVEAAGLQAE